MLHVCRRRCQFYCRAGSYQVGICYVTPVGNVLNRVISAGKFFHVPDVIGITYLPHGRVHVIIAFNSIPRRSGTDIFAFGVVPFLVGNGVVTRLYLELPVVEVVNGGLERGVSCRILFLGVSIAVLEHGLGLVVFRLGYVIKFLAVLSGVEAYVVVVYERINHGGETVFVLCCLDEFPFLFGHFHYVPRTFAIERDIGPCGKRAFVCFAGAVLGAVIYVFRNFGTYVELTGVCYIGKHLCGFHIACQAYRRFVLVYDIGVVYVCSGGRALDCVVARRLRLECPHVTNVLLCYVPAHVVAAARSIQADWLHFFGKRCVSRAYVIVFARFGNNYARLGLCLVALQLARKLGHLLLACAAGAERY